MGIVVACVNQKGGVAKSTTLSALAYILNNKGYRVLSINLDPQRNLDMLAGENIAIPRRDIITKNILHVLNGSCSLNDVIVKTELGDLARASNQLYNWTGPCVLTKDEFMSLKKNPDKLIELLTNRFSNLDSEKKSFRTLEIAVKDIKSKYDFILIDTNPSLTLLTLNGIYAADYCLIPAFAEESSKQAIQELWDTIQSVTYYDPSRYLKIAGILITRYNSRTILSKRFVKQYSKLAEILDTKLFDTKIRHSVSAAECMETQHNIIKYDTNGTTTNDYQAFAEEFIERVKEMEAIRYGKKTNSKR